MCLTKKSKPNWDIHRSDTSLKPLTDELNNTDHLLTMQCSARKCGSWHSCWPHLTRTTHSNTIAIYCTPPMAMVLRDDGGGAPAGQCTLPHHKKLLRNFPQNVTKSWRRWPGLQIAQLPILVSKSDPGWPYLTACRTQRICRHCPGSETTGQCQSLTQGGVSMDWTSYGCSIRLGSWDFGGQVDTFFHFLWAIPEQFPRWQGALPSGSAGCYEDRVLGSTMVFGRMVHVESHPHECRDPQFLWRNISLKLDDHCYSLHLSVVLLLWLIGVSSHWQQ